MTFGGSRSTLGTRGHETRLQRINIGLQSVCFFEHLLPSATHTLHPYSPHHSPFHAFTVSPCKDALINSPRACKHGSLIPILSISFSYRFSLARLPSYHDHRPQALRTTPLQTPDTRLPSHSLPSKAHCSHEPKTPSGSSPLPRSIRPHPYAPCNSCHLLYQQPAGIAIPENQMASHAFATSFPASSLASPCYIPACRHSPSQLASLGNWATKPCTCR